MPHAEEASHYNDLIFYQKMPNIHLRLRDNELTKITTQRIMDIVSE